MMFRTFRLIILFFVCGSYSAFAGDSDFIEWHSTNIQVLKGSDYKLGDDERTIVTIEHANRWSHGDFFMFFDQSWPNSSDPSFYMEPTLRLSLGKISGQSFSKGPIKDVLLAGQLEIPEGQDVRTLIGGAVDLNVPNFTFFKTHLFLRDNPNLAGTTYQTTIAYKTGFDVGDVPFVLEGFADIVGREGTASPYQLFVPRFLMDLGAVTALPDGKVWMGLEWQYWHNKFGVKGVTESVPQIQVKYVF